MIKRILAVLMAVLLFQSGGFAQEISGTVKSYSEGINKNSYIRVVPPSTFQERALLKRTVNNLFDVSYEGCTGEIENAFGYATDIWSDIISVSNDRKIKVKVKYEQLDGNKLAGTDTKFRNNFTGQPYSGYQYPQSFARSKDSNVDPTDTSYDFVITFNVNTAFNFATDGIPVEDKYDFVTIAMHEIGHGLGLAPSMGVSGSKGYYGENGWLNNTNSTYPTIYDKFLKTTKYLTEIADSSDELYSNLTGSNLYFTGDYTKQVNGGAMPKLYAPSQWAQGTSIAHLDTIFNGWNKNYSNMLMTPFCTMAEVIHDPGVIVVGMLRDIGWTVNRHIAFKNINSETVISKNSRTLIKCSDTYPSGEKLNLVLYRAISGSLSPVFVENVISQMVFSDSASCIWAVDNKYESGNYLLRIEKFATSIVYGQSQVFAISDKPAVPVFNPAGGGVYAGKKIQISCGTPGAVIRYNLNATEPNENSTIYSTDNPIIINNDVVISAKAFLTLPSGTVVSSGVAQASYNIKTNLQSKDIALTYTTYSHSTSNKYVYDNCDGIKLGFNDGYVYRAEVRCNLNTIPLGATIKNVELHTKFEPYSTVTTFSIKKINTVSDNDSIRWANLNSGPVIATLNSQLPDDEYYYSVPNLPGILEAHRNSNDANFYMAFVNTNESDQSLFLTYNGNYGYMTVYYEENKNVTYDQVDINGSSQDSIGIFESNNWVMKKVPYSKYLKVNTNSIVRSSSKLLSDPPQKFESWTSSDSSTFSNVALLKVKSGSNWFVSNLNKTIGNIKVRNLYEGFPGIDPAGDSVMFKDPWLMDKYDATYKTFRNQSMSAPFKKRSSPFVPTLSESFGQDVHKGVFLKKLVQDKYYYSVKADTMQTVQLQSGGAVTNCKFVNWSSKDADVSHMNTKVNGNYETPVVFTEENAVVNANYKVPHWAGNANTLANSSQRKIDRTDDGILHLVYESMGYVWYETSSDNGATWQLMNNGKPLGLREAKSPSISARYNSRMITFQRKKENGGSEIVLYYSDNSSDRYEVLWEVPEELYESSNNCPTITQGTHGFLVAFRKNASSYDETNTYLLDPGVYVFLGRYSSYTTSIHKYGIFSVAYDESGNVNTNPAIFSPRNFNPAVNSRFDVVWEKHNGASSHIQYAKIRVLPNGTSPASMTFVNNISSGSGSSNNVMPSIISNYSSTDTNQAVRIVWKAGTSTAVDFDGNPIVKYTTVLKDPYNTNYYKKLGANVDCPSISITDNVFGYTVSWSENNGQYNKVVNNSMTSIKTTNTTGRGFHISNGPNLNTMYGISLRTQSVPYYFTSTGNMGSLFSSTAKISGTDMSTGREGIVSNDSLMISYAIKDISVDGQDVAFRQISDSAKILNNTDARSYLQTESFAINNNSVVNYNVNCGLTSGLTNAALKNNQSVSFNVELVDELTNAVIATADRLVFDENHTIAAENSGYQINCKGAGDRRVKLRLVINDNIGATYTVSDLLSDNDEEVNKNSIKNVSLNDNIVIKTYALEQNYPNPFNPVTRISYQIPEAGTVTLKVYDILGKEVATLVNQYKNQGRYQADFNAGKLASGMYIYELRCNKYVSTKKMMVLK